jgi:hypothetical protein
MAVNFLANENKQAIRQINLVACLFSANNLVYVLTKRFPEKFQKGF